MTPRSPTLDPVALRTEAETHLRALAGDAAHLRDDQWTAIKTLVAGRQRALVVQRTGWGKSAVYFIATALLRARGAGPTIIVSPLLALMRNQIAAAERAGIHAVTINSSNGDEWATVHDRIHHGEVDVLLVSPERLNNPTFRDEVLPRLGAAAGLLVIDEAHCISDWGHDFRPDYRRIRTLLSDLPPGIPVLATTATANARVTEDVAEQLATGTGEVIVLRGSLERESLHLAVVQLPGQAHRLAWLAEHLGGFEGSGIIYTLTVAATQEVADHLRAHGIAAVAYSGQTEQTERLQIEDDLIHNRIKAVVATSALGMGFDKPDLGFVVHLGAPPSPIAYYQQVGRAGRAVTKASVILLPGREDSAVWDYFGSLAFPPERLVRQTLDALRDNAGGAMSTAALETHVELRRTRLDTMLKVLDVDGAVRRVGGGWRATGMEWVYDADRYARVAEARRAEQNAMSEYIATTGCRMEFLRRALDDPDAAPCGRCDNCGGIVVSGSVDERTVHTAADRLQRPGVPLELRHQWPSAMANLGIDLKGRIPEDELASSGRAIARVTDLGWGSALRDLLAPGTPDGELPVPLRRALANVLDAWDFKDRPDSIAVMGSVRRPLLLAHLADGLSRYTKWPVIAELRTCGDQLSPTGPVNSAQRLRRLHNRFRLNVRESLTGRSVLLLDDFTDSGWTLTVAARQLRLGGASCVHPLVLAIA